MATNGQANMVEMETFLPKDGSNLANRDSKYKITVSPAKKRDLEASERLNNVDGKYYDPFKERKVEHPTSDCDTLTHLLKASLGTGILAMPEAFKNAGLTLGIVFTILVAVVCTHCCYIVIKCAHVLYYRTKVSSMSFADVGEVAFANGPPWGRKFSKLARLSIQVGLFLAYFGTCSVYTVIIAVNLQHVVDHYLGIELDQRVYIMCLLLPLILLSWVPNLKALAPVSMVANVFMGLGIGITFYYLVQDLPSPRDLPQTAPLLKIPIFFSICIFAMEAIGVVKTITYKCIELEEDHQDVDVSTVRRPKVGAPLQSRPLVHDELEIKGCGVMPLENSMEHPQHFIGLCGVLNQGMGGVTLIYILLGFLGYVKYGEDTLGSITLNLPNDELLAQSVKVLVACAVFCTYGLQYYVCLEIVWNGIKERYSKNARLAEYVVRTLLTTAAVLLAVAVPTIGPFIGLIGAFCFSLLGLIIPIFIETVTYWDVGFGPCNWVVFKNIILFVFGVLSLVFGSYTSILEIVAIYSPAESNSTAAYNTTGGSNTTLDLNSTEAVLSTVNSTIAAVNNLMSTST